MDKVWSGKDLTSVATSVQFDKFGSIFYVNNITVHTFFSIFYLCQLKLHTKWGY